MNSIAPTRSSIKKLSECSTLQEAFQSQEFGGRIAELAGKQMDPVRLYRLFMLAASKNPLIYQVPVRQVLGQLFTVASLALEPNGPHGHVYLIPFKEKIWNPETRKRDKEQMSLQVITGYQGYAELFWRTGFVSNIHTDVVLPGDEFDFAYGTDAFCKHKPMGKASLDADPVWAYSHIKMSLENGAQGQAFEVMPWADVLRIRNSSQGYRRAVEAKDEAESKGWKNLPATYTEAPWVKHLRAMGRKTPLRQISKIMRKTPAIAGVTAMEEAQEEGRRLDWGMVIDGKASIVEGGIPESDDQEDPAPAAPDTAFGIRSGNQDRPGVQDKGSERQEVAKQQTGQKPSQATDQQKERDGQPASQTPTFEGWLADEVGEMVQPDPINDPVSFVQAVEKLWESSNNKQAIIENNIDCLDEAAAISPRARLILDALIGGATDDSSFPIIAVTEGRNSWLTYVDAIALSLDPQKGHGVTPDRLSEWAEVQSAAILRAPQPIRIKIAKVVAEWAAAAKVDVPAVISNALRSGRARTEQNQSGQQAADRSPEPQAQGERPSEQQQDPEQQRAKADAEAEALTTEVLRYLADAVAKAKAASNNRPVLDLLANPALQRQLASLKGPYPGRYNRVLDACLEKTVFPMLSDVQSPYPHFYDDLIARQVQGNEA